MTMDKSTLQNCLACFERFEIDAEIYSDDTIHVMTHNPDVYVEISKQEIVWRADQHLELLKQESYDEETMEHSPKFTDNED